jgi:hypothetical protein
MHEKVSHFLVQQMDKQVMHQNLQTELLQHMNHQSFVSTASALSIFTTFFCGVLDLSIKKADSSKLMDDTFYCCPRVEKLHVREDDLFDIGC